MKDFIYQTNSQDCHVDHCPFRENTTSSATYCARQSCLNRVPLPQTSKTTILIRNMGYQIGDTVFYADGDFIEKVKITDFFSDNGRQFAKVHCLEIGGMCNVQVSHLHKTYEECKRVNRSIAERKQDEYQSQIKSVKDLLVFALQHDLTASEYGDPSARAAFLKQASELTGIDLREETK